MTAEGREAPPGAGVMSSSRIEGILARLREPDAVAILVRARLRREGRPWMDQGPAPTVPVARPGQQSAVPQAADGGKRSGQLRQIRARLT